MQSGNFWKTGLIFFAIVIAILGLFALWNAYFGSDRIDIEETAKNFEKLEQDIKTALKADTYGGKTPQETLDLFIDALRKEDVELAAKYFMLDLNFTKENQEYFLTRKKWEEGLEKAKAEGRLRGIVSELEKMESSNREMSSENKFEFILKNTDGSTERAAILVLNEENAVWKIESM